MNRPTPLWIVAVLTFTNLASPAARAEPAADASKAQQALATAAASQQYTFLVFYKDNAAATQSMTSTVKRGVETRSDRAIAVYVDVADAVEKPLVDRFGIDRAPLPMTIAVAPNGAVTGVYSKTISDERLASAFVSPGVAQSLKAMQDGKMVFICVSTTGTANAPAGVTEFRNDPEFHHRSALIHIPQGSRGEAEFLKELELESPGGEGATVALLAPPGVLVGKFKSTATKDEIAAALHAAGKCCDDPNCKHNKN